MCHAGPPGRPRDLAALRSSGLLYEAAAARPDRANLDDVRRGQFEGLRDIVRKEAVRRPDLGGPGLHPTAGACAVGARKFLVDYNVYFDSADVTMVRAIAVRFVLRLAVSKV